jgi:hypothetical protein
MSDTAKDQKGLRDASPEGRFAAALVALGLAGGLVGCFADDFDQGAFIHESCAAHGGVNNITSSRDGTAKDFTCRDGSSGWAGMAFNSDFYPTNPHKSSSESGVN